MANINERSIVISGTGILSDAGALLSKMLKNKN